MMRTLGFLIAVMTGCGGVVPDCTPDAGWEEHPRCGNSEEVHPDGGEEAFGVDSEKLAGQLEEEIKRPS